MGDQILQVESLKVYFDTEAGPVKAVDDISFDIKKGRVFGLVGESGSGKTLTALSILKIIPEAGRIAGGEILFNGVNLLSMEGNSLRAIRGAKISMVFLEPASALNPVFTVGEQIMEAVLAHRKVSGCQAREIAINFLERVHIREPMRIFHDYPHQLSGGTKQRACIAMALVNSPELLVLDEPTTALDVTIQAQILDLLDEIIEKEKASILFISHDFGVIDRMCDDVGVMYKGKIVEAGPKENILTHPRQPYTISLLESVKALT